jgi:hypothetical protein
MLRLDPHQRPRLVEIIRNLAERITEARMNGWLGEVQGLQTSMQAAKNKLASLDRKPRTRPGALTDLGIPAINAASPSLSHVVTRPADQAVDELGESPAR